MKKTSLYVLWIVICVLVAAVLTLAAVAFWMEKKTGYAPAAPSAAAPAGVPAEKAASVEVQVPAAAADQEAVRSEQSPQQEEQRDVEYDEVVRGPMTM